MKKHHSKKKISRRKRLVSKIVFYEGQLEKLTPFQVPREDPSYTYIETAKPKKLNLFQRMFGGKK